ncbi:MAG: Rieske 2Fe-2S domain-containing protein, partial [Chloroflexi bacterium]|nr:Rieske 2Fe-2S domain-containing protein [Chloroflexota bacterium]
MTTRRAEPDNAPLPSPFPEGWYFITSREAIQKARLIQKTWMGEDIIVWCDESGRICVAGAYCPHLGSDLGPAAGGRVRDGRLVCPFHGFEYDATGQCVATPYAPPPRAARLRVFAPQEIAGLIFAWSGVVRR